ncbi:MAG TPA: dihydroorotate dehydrogenase [Thermoproteota archaeon]|nr:dihydroorotate dehydrogenase [Thermoproteota archaeon]
MNASGVLSNAASLLRKVAAAGAGAVVSKSATLEPREGHENPTYIKLDYGVINAMGLPNPGYETIAKELGELTDLGVPVIASIAPADDVGARLMAKRMNSVVSAIEINLSCPHASRLGQEVADDPEMVMRIARETKAASSKPVFVKLPPIRSDCISMVQELDFVDGFVVSNTMRAMAIDVSAGKPVLSNKFGGLSGHALHPVVVGLLYELYETTKKPLVGAGGVSDWDDAAELMLAGATAVQVGTASGDLQVYSRISQGVSQYLDEQGTSISELIGLAHDA